MSQFFLLYHYQLTVVSFEKLLTPNALCTFHLPLALFM